MKIAIDGMDGSGKTSLAKRISENLGFLYIDKPFKFLFQQLDLSEQQIKSLEWELYKTEDEAVISTFYGLGLLYGTRCNDSENVIYDRHYASNYYWHSNDETAFLHKEFIKLGGLPDLTILLKANVDTRMKRIYQRDKCDKDLCNSAMYDDGFEKLYNFLSENNFNFIVIDTNDITIDEVFDIAVSKIKEYKFKILKKERK